MEVPVFTITPRMGWFPLETLNSLSFSELMICLYNLKAVFYKPQILYLFIFKPFQSIKSVHLPSFPCFLTVCHGLKLCLLSQKLILVFLYKLLFIHFHAEGNNRIFCSPQMLAQDCRHGQP